MHSYCMCFHKVGTDMKTSPKFSWFKCHLVAESGVDLYSTPTSHQIHQHQTAMINSSFNIFI